MKKIKLKKLIKLLGEPSQKKPDWDDVSTYWTLDNGIELSYLSVCNLENFKFDGILYVTRVFDEDDVVLYPDINLNEDQEFEFEIKTKKDLKEIIKNYNHIPEDQREW